MSFPFHCMQHRHSYILMKTPSILNSPFQRYSHFSDAQNNKIQRELNTITISIIGYIFKSITASSNSFCLITSQISSLFCTGVKSKIYIGRCQNLWWCNLLIRTFWWSAFIMSRYIGLNTSIFSFLILQEGRLPQGHQMPGFPKIWHGLPV